ncbi:MAG TPA: class I SAM-dependent methyltransferase [Candidatus Binatia bacterium]|nr:class I SAM-dependent methyltransferase [Candidatus Binatia bacterium]
MSQPHVQSQPASLLGVIAGSLLSRNSAERHLELVRTWAHLGRYRSLALCRLPARIRERADLPRIARLGAEMADARRADPACAAKYADYRFWIPFNVARIGALSLHRSPPLRILDIGCGPGYFLAAALACGHECHGVDAPPAALTSVEARVYGEMLAALSCASRVSPLLIERFVPMSLPFRDLDLITAFWICFNRHQQPDEWGASEWRFFVDDATSHLRDGGTLHLELNSNPQRYGRLEWYDTDTLDFFRSVGAVERNVVRITKGKPQAWEQARSQA